MKSAMILFAFLSLFAVAVWSLPVENDPYEFADRDGIWVSIKSGDHAFRELALSSEDQLLAVQKLESIFKILESSGVLKPLRGVALRADKIVEARADNMGRYSGTNPIVLKVGLTIGDYVRDPNGRIVPFTIEKPRLEIYANDIYTTAATCKSNKLFYEGLTDNKGRDFFYEPQAVAKTESGYNIYMLDDSVEEVLITKRRPLWIPATSEQFLRAMMDYEGRNRAREIEDDRQSGRSSISEDQSFHVRRLRVFEKELAELAQEERTQPAYCAPSASFEKSMQSGLAGAGTPGARAIVMINPEYFDRSLPRTAVQLIACRFDYQIPYSSRSNDDGQSGVSASLLNRLARRFEYGKLEALIERTK